MKILAELTDAAVLAEIGERLASRRLERGLTQAELAEQAGVGKRTVERIESGASAQMVSLIRLLRILDLLPNLEQLLPEPLPSPMDQLQRAGKPRQRASARQADKQPNAPWSWDDDS